MKQSKQADSYIKSRDRIKVVFSINGDYFDVDKFSDIIGIAPTDYFYKGQKGQYVSKRIETTWKYELSTNEPCMGELTNKLYTLLVDKVHSINVFLKTNNLYIALNIIYWVFEDEVFPSIIFEPKLLKVLSDIKCNIDIDGYMG